MAGRFIYDVCDSSPTTSDGRGACAKVLGSHFHLSLNTSYTTVYTKYRLKRLKREMNLSPIVYTAYITPALRIKSLLYGITIYIYGPLNILLFVKVLSLFYKYKYIRQCNFINWTGEYKIINFIIICIIISFYLIKS